MGTEAIMALKKKNCIENLLYWAVKGEHDTFYFASVSTTKHALNPLKKKKKDQGPSDSLLCFNKEWTSLVKASCWAVFAEF